jgi:thiamine biosynthesis lipoprotein
MRLNLDMWKTILTILVPTVMPAQVPGPIVDRLVLAMGTELHLHLEGVGTVAGSQAALSECARIEAECSTWNPASLWSRLNAAQGNPVRVGHEWIALLGQMKAWNLCTGGAFDPGLMALMQAWDVRGKGCVPTVEALTAARKASGADLLELDAEADTARWTHAHAGVEEGGFLKGYALDRMRKASRVRSGWIDFGGQILAWGPPRPVSIADPQHRDTTWLNLELRNASLSCSGTSERGRHILDPRNGQRCPAWGATAVVAPEALTADVVSTALYVLGPEAGLVWAEHHKVAAAFLLNDGTIRMTGAFRALNPTDARPESR